MAEGVHVLRLFRSGARVSWEEVVSAMADPDPAVDDEITANSLEWPVGDDILLHVAADLIRAVPVRRWVRCAQSCVSLLYAPGAAAVPPEDRDVVASGLWDVLGAGSLGWAADWARRVDVFTPEEAAAFASEAVTRNTPWGGHPDPDIVDVAAALAERGRMAAALRLVHQLPDGPPDWWIEMVDPTVWASWITSDPVMAEIERTFEDPLMLRVLHHLAETRSPEALPACIEVLSRAPDHGSSIGFDVVQALAKTHGSDVAQPFQDALHSDLGFDDDRDSAGLAMRHALAALGVLMRVRLVGEVACRPRMLNPVGTGWRPCPAVPVFIDGVFAGEARAARYPDAATNEVEFEAELDPRVAPTEWRDREVDLERVEQSSGWPGPAALRICVERNAVWRRTGDG